jgi:hypothetical protein
MNFSKVFQTTFQRIISLDFFQNLSKNISPESARNIDGGKILTHFFLSFFNFYCKGDFIYFLF